jgi:homoserine kinase
VPERLHIAVVHPHCAVATAAARTLLDGRTFSLGQAVANSGNLAALVAALFTQDLELLGRSISDAIVEPIRAHLVPAFVEVKQAALRSGALGCGLSGSGPSMFAFAGDEPTATAVGAAMQRAFSQAASLESESYVQQVNKHGATRLE